MASEVIVNGRFLGRRISGVERYAGEVLKRFGTRPNVTRPKRTIGGLAGHIWEQFMLPGMIPSGAVLWSPANTGPIAVKRQVVTIHDLSPLEHPEWYRRDFSFWYRLMWPLLARRVTRIITSSEFVRKKAMARFGVEHVTVAPGGVDRSFFRPDAQQDAHALPERYILFIGSLAPRKNLTGLLLAWAEIHERFSDIWLVVAGESKPIFPALSFSDLKNVIFLGYVADRDLPGLYAHAMLLALPSLDEGFGLPALEAMACGAPVLVSDAGALPETVGGAAAVFPLSEPNALTETLIGLLEDAAWRASLREKGLIRARQFEWQSSTDSIWRALNEI